MPIYGSLTLRARILANDEPAWLKKHARRDYIVQVHLATPRWYSRKEVVRLKQKAHELSKAKRRKYVLDHIIPLTHKRVCGLNVHHNMQIIDAGTNARKSNHWCEWHGELFAEPEQFPLFR